MNECELALKYRRAVPAEARLLAEFQLAMAAETESLDLDPPTVLAGTQAVFADPARGQYYVAESGGQIVGSLLITFEWSDWRNGVIWWIQSVYVLPEHRRRGVYAGLYRHLCQLAAAAPDVRGIRLYVDQRNHRAQAVYERLGMNGEHYRVFEWLA
jgi:GNAT superfamily N-acetyltransferase